MRGEAAMGYEGTVMSQGTKEKVCLSGVPQSIRTVLTRRIKHQTRAVHRKAQIFKCVSLVGGSQRLHMTYKSSRNPSLI